MYVASLLQCKWPLIEKGPNLWRTIPLGVRVCFPAIPEIPELHHRLDVRSSMAGRLCIRFFPDWYNHPRAHQRS
jgi:hypothetical protein